MNPIALAVRQSRAVVMITALVAAAGLFTGFSLPSDIYPPLQFPRIVVIAHAGMTPADSMVLTVTRPIEQAIMEVPGIRRVRSRTFRGASEVSGQFDPATNMVVALQQVQNRVGEARPDMPPDLDLIVDLISNLGSCYQGQRFQIARYLFHLITQVQQRELGVKRFTKSGSL